MSEPKQHECPYGGYVTEQPNIPPEVFVGKGLDSGLIAARMSWPCGTHGGLCDRCQQDRADARQQQEHKFLREMTDANVERLRAAAFRYAGERIEEVQLRIDDLSKAMCDRLSVLEARP